MVDGQPWRRLMVAADTGGAIKGPNRFDLFLGAGAEAGRKAGALSAPLSATILLPNSAAGRLTP
jgi:membrane-bound lytic murein transglycosylase A